jgi:hypothetical protein
MLRTLLVTLLATALLAAGCGIDDEPTETSDALPELADLATPDTTGGFGAAVQPEDQDWPDLRDHPAFELMPCEEVQERAGFELLHLPDPPDAAPETICYVEVDARDRLFANVRYVPEEMADGDADGFEMIHAGGLHLGMHVIRERPHYERDPQRGRETAEVRGENARVQLLGTRGRAVVRWAEQRGDELVLISLHGAYDPDQMVAYGRSLRDGLPPERP